jgi:lysozyme
VKISVVGKNLIKKYEGYEDHVYKDAVNVLTAGWGTTGPHINALKAGTKITKKQAEAWFNEDVKEVDDALNRLITIDDLPQACVDAIGSLTYNIGTNALGRSTLLRLVNEGSWEKAASEFDRWNKAGGKVLKGLVRRRAEEKSLFLSGLADEGSEEKHESNIEAECEKPRALHKEPAVQGTAAIGTAAILSEQAEKISMFAGYSDYITYLFVGLTVLGIIYALKGRSNKE